MEHSHVYVVTEADFTLQWQTVVATEGYVSSKAQTIFYLAIYRISLLTPALNVYFRFLYTLSCAINASRPQRVISGSFLFSKLQSPEDILHFPTSIPNFPEVNIQISLSFMVLPGAVPHFHLSQEHDHMGVLLIPDKEMYMTFLMKKTHLLISR